MFVFVKNGFSGLIKQRMDECFHPSARLINHKRKDKVKVIKERKARGWNLRGRDIKVGGPAVAWSPQ